MVNLSKKKFKRMSKRLIQTVNRVLGAETARADRYGLQIARVLPQLMRWREKAGSAQSAVVATEELDRILAVFHEV